MGTGIEYMDPSKEGILPLAIMHIFERCANHERQTESKEITLSKCVISCQFIEVNIGSTYLDNYYSYLDLQ